MTNTNIADAVDVANDKARYDAAVKRILSDKNILAWIMKGTMREFQDTTIEQIIACIEGIPKVSEISIEPGRTNAAIIGDTTEDKVPNEGSVLFDIRFHAVTPDKKRIQLIINVEAQKNYYPGYDLVTRGVFYGARLLSSQKEREFKGSEYDDIKKVYSIWVCMNAPKYLQNTITEYSIQQEKIYGDFSGRVRYDLMSVVMICLGSEEEEVNETDEQARLLRLLSVLASERMEPKQKLKILQEEYHIQVAEKLGEEVNEMCNWSEGIEERATARGLAKGMAQGLEQGLEQGLQQGMQQGEILGALGVYLELGLTEEGIIAKMKEKFSLTQEEAEKYLRQKQKA